MFNHEDAALVVVYCCHAAPSAGWCHGMGSIEGRGGCAKLLAAHCVVALMLAARCVVTLLLAAHCVVTLLLAVHCVVTLLLAAHCVVALM